MKKQKKFGRKLALNKETIERLTQSDNKKVVGGITKPTMCGITNEWMPCPCEYPDTTPPTLICTKYCC
jgi:hypothetical protein